MLIKQQNKEKARMIQFRNEVKLTIYFYNKKSYAF